MSDGKVKFKVGQKVVCSDGVVPTVIGTTIGFYGESPEELELVGVKISEDFLDVGDVLHDGSHADLIDENGIALNYRSERDDCRFYEVRNVKVLGEV